MIARVLAPDRVLFDAPVQKVVAETVGGSRGFLPHHIDWVAPLRPGLVVLTLPDGSERFVAVEGGVLVKKGDRLTVTSPRAILSESLDALPGNVARHFEEEAESERAARRAIGQLETKLVKEIVEFLR